MSRKLTGGVSPFPPSCYTALQNLSPLLHLLLLQPHLCPHATSAELYQTQWQGRMMADNPAGCCCFRLCLAREVVVTPGTRVTLQPEPRREECILHGTHRAQLLTLKQTGWISPTLTVPQKQPFSPKLAKLFLTLSSALPLPSIFSSLANSPNVGKAFCQTGRDFASTLQLPHVIFSPEAGKQFSHILLTSGQKSW